MKLSLILQMIAILLFASLPWSPPPTNAESHHQPKTSSNKSITPSPPSTRHDHHPHHQTHPQQEQSRRKTDRVDRRHLHQSWLTLSKAERRERLRELRVFKTNLLRILGLNSEPRPKTRVRIPSYMWELYNQMSNRNNGVKRPVKVMKRDGKRLEYDGNSIRSFEYIDVESIDSNTIRFFFNLSNDLDNENFNGAELRLFRQTSSRINGTGASPASASATGRRRANNGRPDEDIDRYKIGVYQLLPVTSHSDSVMTSRLLEAKIVDSSVEGWESFDVSAAVRSWQSDPGSDRGLQVKVTTIDDQPLGVSARVRVRRSIPAPGSNKEPTEEPEEVVGPLLVTYGDDRGQQQQDDDVTQRERRHRRRIRKRGSGSGGRRKMSGGRGAHCRRRPLYIDFKELEWNDWIFAPPGYQAFMCNGSCPVVLPDHLNATNHAQIQSLLHSVNRVLVPPPCCVPTELSTISMLYVNEMDRVVLKNYEDMVVDACGCR